MSSEPTVEQTLLQLREIFPDRQVSVDISFPEHSNTPRYYIQVGVNGQDFHGPKLSKLMNQVRQWHKENKGNG